MAAYSCYHINPIAAARCLWQTHTFLLSKMTVLAQSSIIKNSPCENFNKTETSIPPLPCKSHWLMNLSFKFKMKENESRTGMEVDLRMWPDLPPQHGNQIIGLNWVNWFWSVVGFLIFALKPLKIEFLQPVKETSMKSKQRNELLNYTCTLIDLRK